MYYIIANVKPFQLYFQTFIKKKVQKVRREARRGWQDYTLAKRLK